MKSFQATTAVGLEIQSEITISFHFTDIFALAQASGKLPSQQIAESPKVTIDGKTWKLKVSPGQPGDSCVCCTLYHELQGELVCMSLTVMPKHGSSAGNHTMRSDVKKMAIQGSEYFWSPFINRPKFLASYCDQGQAHFTAHIKIYGQRTEQVHIAPVEELHQLKTLVRPIGSASLLFNPACSDLTLMVEGERIPAHKCLLCPRSAVFHAMFQHPMKEAASNEVQIGEHSAAAVKAMLSFLYLGTISGCGGGSGGGASIWLCAGAGTGNMKAAMAQLLPELLSLAVFYQIADLQEFIEDAWSAHLTVDNALEYLNRAQFLQQQQLVQCTVRFVAKHYQAISEQPAFKQALSTEACLQVMDALTNGSADTPVVMRRRQIAETEHNMLPDWMVTSTACLGSSYDRLRLWGSVVWKMLRD